VKILGQASTPGLPQTLDGSHYFRVTIPSYALNHRKTVRRATTVLARFALFVIQQWRKKYKSQSKLSSTCRTRNDINQSYTRDYMTMYVALSRRRQLNSTRRDQAVQSLHDGGLAVVFSQSELLVFLLSVNKT